MNPVPPPLADPHSTAPLPSTRPSRAKGIWVLVWLIFVVVVVIPLAEGVLTFWGAPGVVLPWRVAAGLTVGFALFIGVPLGFLTLALGRYFRHARKHGE